MTLTELGLYKVTKMSFWGKPLEGYSCEAVSASPNNNLPEPFYMPAEPMPEDGWEKEKVVSEVTYPSGVYKETIWHHPDCTIKLMVRSGNYFGPKVELI